VKRTKFYVTLLTVTAVVLTGAVFYAFATPPGSPYAPGETLIPTCAPGSLNCTVTAPAISGANSDITSLTGLTTALSVSQGGTGAVTFATNGLLYGNGTSALQVTSAGTSAQLLLADASGIPTFATMSGEATISNTGSVTLANTTVGAGAYGSASSVGNFTVDSKGRLTAAALTPIAIDGSQVTTGTVAEAQLPAYQYLPTHAGIDTTGTVVSNGDGTVNVSANTASFLNNAKTRISRVSIAADPALALVDDSANFIAADRDTGTWVAFTSISSIDYIRYIPYAEVFRSGTNVHVQIAPLKGYGEVESSYERTEKTERYARESGLDPITVNASLEVTIPGGTVWSVNTPYVIPSSSATSREFFNYHVAGVWTRVSHLNPLIDNLQYDNGTDLVAATPGKYLINYIYRGVEGQDHVYIVLGNAEYDSVNLAQSSTFLASVPEIIDSHAMLVGRVIVQQGATTGYVVESAFAETFAGASIINDHGSLAGLADDDHLQYALLAGRDATPNSGQTLIGGLTTTSDLIFRTTSANAISGADMIFQTGNDGGTEAFRVLFDGTIDTANNLITNIGNAGTDFTAGGGLTLAGLLTADNGFTMTTGALNATANSASSLTTSVGGLTLTGAAASTWSTSAGALTITSATGATWGTAAGDLNFQAGGAGVTANVKIGSGAGSATPDLLVLDLKTDNATDPTGVEGGIYYNDFAGIFRCYEGGIWKDCITVDDRALSSLTSATGVNSLSNGDNSQAWNWDLTTASNSGMIFGENIASTATGTPSIVTARTMAGSTAMPLYIKNLGDGRSFQVDDSAADLTSFFIDADGSVVIGSNVSNPNAQLTVYAPAGTANVMTAIGSKDDNLSVRVQNTSATALASSVLSARADNTDAIFPNNNSAVLGITSSAFANPTYSIAGPDDAFLLALGQDLIMGTGSPLGTGNIQFATGGSTPSNERMRISKTGLVGINTTSSAAYLEIKDGVATDALRLAGSTSGYIGFKPSAVAGSTTYTWPAADGTSGQALTTNGSGVLSWTPAAVVLQRIGTTLSPINAGDDITTTGAIYTTGALGLITSSGLLTGQAGLTVTGADVNLNAGATAASDFNTNINNGTSIGSVNIGNSLAGAIGITSGAGLTLTGGAASSINTTAGAITLQPAGSGTTSTVQIGVGGAGSGTPDLLALDVKSTTGDPVAGAEGQMYYNTFDNSFRCYVDGGGWQNCDTTGGTATLQSAYNAGNAISTGGTNIAFTLNTTDQFSVTGTGTINMGTGTDIQSLNFGTGGTGAKTVAVGSTASTGATTINSGTGNINLQPAGTGASGYVQVGAGGAGSTTPDLLALDVKSDAEGALPGVDGAMYYNELLEDFRCFVNGGWQSCGATAASATTLQQAYSTGQNINLETTDLTFNADSTGNFIIQDATVPFATFANDGSITLGKSATASTINIGVGTAADTINIGTGGTTADAITIGNAVGDLVLNDNNWSINSAGAITTTNNISTTGTGTITSAGTLTASNGLTVSSGATTFTGLTTNGGLLYTNGSGVLAQMASSGTSTTVLHGNAAGAPSYSSVALATDVSGTLPIANGGTGQTTAVAAFDALSPNTTKGDLITRDGTNNIRLGTGTDGQVLTANSATATGLQWQTPTSTPTLQQAYDAGSSITTSASTDISFILSSGAFTVSGTGPVNLNPTSVLGSSFTSGLGALTLTAGATSTWSTTAGNLTLDSAGVLNLGNVTATSIVLGRAAAPFTLTSTGLNVSTGGALTGVSTINASGLITGSGGLTITGAAVNLNDSSNFATNINTGISNGTVSIGTGGTAQTIAIGDTADTLTINSTGLNVSATGALTGVASIDTIATSATALTFAGAGAVSSTGANALSLDGGTTGVLNLNNTSTGDILIGGGSGSTGCTVANATGDLTCSGAITSTATSGNQGYWNRTATTLSPATAGDAITTSGNISTSGTGTITSAGLLTASNGLTQTTGALNLTATSGALTLSGLGASSINTGINALTISSSNFNITATGINSTAIGATTASTGKFTTLTSTGATDLANAGASNVTIATTGTGTVAIGNATGTFALTSSGGLNVTTGGALTGVASIDTIATSATALTFAGTGTLSSGAGTALTIDSGTTGNLLIGTDASAETINIGTGAAVKTVTLGSTNTTSTTNIQSGTGGILMTAGVTGSSSNVRIGNSATATPDLLVLDNGTADPAAVNGGMYYNTTTGKMRCAEGGAWKNCDSSQPSSFTDATSDTLNDSLQSLWDGTQPNITLPSTLDSVLVTAVVRVSATNTDNEYNSFEIHRSTTGVNATCADTILGTRFGTFSTDIAFTSASASFVDSPASVGQLRYTVCETTDSLTSGGTVDNTTPTIIVTLSRLGADLAENYYTNDKSIEPGDVVALDSSLPAGVKKSAIAYDAKTIGIISTSPGLTLDDGIGLGLGRPVPVALSGRVPVKVTSENGSIAPGDYLTPSSTPGTAMKATKSGVIIGQAMTAFNGDGIGSVLTFVKTSYYNGESDELFASTDVLGTLAGRATVAATKAATSYSSNISTDRIAAGLEVITPSVVAQKISADNITTSTDTDLSINLKDGKLMKILNANGETAVSFDAQGNAAFVGELTVKKATIMDLNAPIIVTLTDGLAALTTRVQALEDLNQNVLSQLNSMNASIAVLNDQVQALQIAGNQNSIDGLAITNVTANGLIVNGSLVINSDAEFFGTPYFTADTAGFATIKSGTDKVEVTFDREYISQPIVSANITINDQPDNAIYDSAVSALLQKGYSYVVAKKSIKGFTIYLNKAAEEDVPFSWIALAVKNAKEFTSVVPSAEPVAPVIPPAAAPVAAGTAPTATSTSSGPLAESALQSPVSAAAPAPVVEPAAPAAVAPDMVAAPTATSTSSGSSAESTLQSTAQVPTPVVEPAPVPVVEPAPAPIVEPAPAPAPAPAPEPAPAPAPAPAPEPAPAPAPAPAPEPAPVA